MCISVGPKYSVLFYNFRPKYKIKELGPKFKIAKVTSSPHQRPPLLMEQRLVAAVGRNPNLSPKSSVAVLSLITNPCTSDSTLTTIVETLNLHLQNPNSNHQQILSLLSALSDYHPRLRHRVGAAVHAFILLPSTPTSALPHALSFLNPADSTALDLFSDESLFLSLCFYECVKTRKWMLRNVSKFRMRPSVLLTVLLGFTKDPYPYIREAALDGLVMILNDGVVVEDRSLVGGCYFRAAELLFDADNSVRRSAVRAVSEWGHLHVALNPDESKRDWSDALFLQLCLMVRDMDMEVRVAAFNALGKIPTVSENILLQTLSKKALPSTKEKVYPGRYTAKLSKIPATAAAFAFLHGLEDEFFQVRRSACRALQTPTVLSAEFSCGTVDILMDMLNDDLVMVRLQALETLHHMATYGHLNVAESHLHMFFSVLIDNDALIRSAMRKTLQYTKLQKLAMFRSCIENLIKNLELYPEDEADIFYALYRIGCLHRKFVVKIIQEVSQELEPSFDGKLGFNKVRTAGLFVLAISAPVSLERKTSSIPPQIFSYAVTLLGRISCGLVEVVDENTLLTYLSQCSRFTFTSTSENFEGGLLDFGLKYNHNHLHEKSNEVSSLFPVTMGPKKFTTPLESQVKAMSCVEIIFQKVVDLWPLIQLGCMNEVTRTLRSWKEGISSFTRDTHQTAGVVVFALKYIHIIKLLGNAWAYSFTKTNLQLKGMGALENLLGKMERRLSEMLYRYVGMSRNEELHILELMLVTYAMRLSHGDTSCFEEYTKKLNSVIRSVECLHKEGPVEGSHFVTELLNVSHEIGDSEDKAVDMPDLLLNSLKLFSLKRIVLSGELKYLDAELDACGNDFQKPLPFVPGLPVGIPFEITLRNMSSEIKLWLAISVGHPE
ncbi:protein SIEL isoform X2 [Salvia miltiorrhiza]|uniref:protein SIEL isoform X2 n=1 Tax=Salvia miltiorrhiza TaxID=226208 RepID=UPI0025AC0333|nr:protein SIEL isoform X2 [Salvia miltiorrhiza]